MPLLSGLFLMLHDVTSVLSAVTTGTAVNGLTWFAGRMRSVLPGRAARSSVDRFGPGALAEGYRLAG